MRKLGEVHVDAFEGTIPLPTTKQVVLELCHLYASVPAEKRGASVPRSVANVLGVANNSVSKVMDGWKKQKKAQARIAYLESAFGTSSTRAPEQEMPAPEAPAAADVEDPAPSEQLALERKQHAKVVDGLHVTIWSDARELKKKELELSKLKTTLAAGSEELTLAVQQVEATRRENSKFEKQRRQLMDRIEALKLTAQRLREEAARDSSRATKRVSCQVAGYTRARDTALLKTREAETRAAAAAELAAEATESSRARALALRLERNLLSARTITYCQYHKLLLVLAKCSPFTRK